MYQTMISHRMANSYPSPRNKSGQSEIYLLSVESGDLRMLTQPPESKLAPDSLLNGSRLVHAQDWQGDECFDIFDLSLSDLSTHNLTPDTPESIYPGLVGLRRGGGLLLLRTGRVSSVSTRYLCRVGCLRFCLSTSTLTSLSLHQAGGTPPLLLALAASGEETSTASSAIA